MRERSLLRRETRTLAQLLWTRRVRVFFLLLAAGLVIFWLKSRNQPFLEQREVVSARGPVQAQVAARLDRTALPVLGQLHDEFFFTRGRSASSTSGKAHWRRRSAQLTKRSARSAVSLCGSCPIRPARQGSTKRCLVKRSEDAATSPLMSWL